MLRQATHGMRFNRRCVQAHALGYVRVTALASVSNVYTIHVFQPSLIMIVYTLASGIAYTLCAQCLFLQELQAWGINFGEIHLQHAYANASDKWVPTLGIADAVNAVGELARFLGTIQNSKIAATNLLDTEIRPRAKIVWLNLCISRCQLNCRRRF